LVEALADLLLAALGMDVGTTAAIEGATVLKVKGRSDG
jgi:hypothetical protein